MIAKQAKVLRYMSVAVENKKLDPDFFKDIQKEKSYFVLKDFLLKLEKHGG